MASGDGLIVRVKPRGGRLTIEQAIGIAASAARFGNSALDLTSRANLQIRGVGHDGLPGLTAALDDLGLLDASPEAESRRNVVVSPLAGLDPMAAFDIRPAVAGLEDRLAAEASLAALPAKFGFAVSDGGQMPFDGPPADVRFDALLDDARPAFAVRLDGDDGTAAVCAASAMPETAIRLARVFVGARSRNQDLHRMRDLVARDGASDVFDRAGLATRRPVSAGRCSTVTEMVGAITLRPERGGVVLGAAAPFGRFDAAQIDGLARNAAAAGALEHRLSPWRAILTTGLDVAAANSLGKACAAAGLIVDPADPRLRVAACVGAPGCHRGTAPTLDLAARWARLVGPGQGIALHVSGCAKGCAHPGSAPLTLVGRDGRFDIVADGCPGDTPSALGLGVDEARRVVRTILRRDAHP